MVPARKQNQANATPGFAIEIDDNAEVGLAMVIAEDEDGHYEPVAVAATIREAKEIAESDLRGRMLRIERGEEAGLCPIIYKLWARGIDGDYRLAQEIQAL
jgi:hypothetical protein